MKPHKHPLLFSALALTLACLLFNASIIQVSAIEPITIGIIIASIIGGAITGWFAHEWLSGKSKTPGVDLDSYMNSIADAWETSVLNMDNYVRNTAVQVEAGKFYYVRLAEYQAKNYVHYESLDNIESDVMRDIAKDLWQVEKSIADGLKYFDVEKVRFDKENNPVEAEIST